MGRLRALDPRRGGCGSRRSHARRSAPHPVAARPGGRHRGRHRCCDLL